MMPYILGVAFVLAVIQSLFSYKQLKSVYAAMAGLRKKYAGEDKLLAIGSARSGLSLSKGVVLLVVVDSDDTVTDVMEMSGYTVLSRPKERSELTGMTCGQVHDMLKGKRRVAFEKAIHMIDNKRTPALAAGN